MSANNKSDLFEFMLERVADTQKQHLDEEPQAFGRWFANLFFLNPRDVFVSDGSRDGKIDLFLTTHNGKAVRHHVLNTKFTREFNKSAPPSFYQEIKYFWQAFENRDVREPYLEKGVKKELRQRYKMLFDRYDSGDAELMFVTNHRINAAHYEQVSNIPVKIFHLDDLIQCIVDDIDGAMPRTPQIALNGIHAVLSPDRADTEVATSIVFARLIDFIRYMESDPFDMLFNRNVRVAISPSQSAVNQSIRDTFDISPNEFAYSNNGITMLCERQHYDPGQKVLTLENPRVVNGSQTLHSIRDVPKPSQTARVMVRIIEIEPPKGENIEEKISRRKRIIDKIAVRSNRQNPIKSWDLASNDDFQLELFRFFRSKELFYERRVREWQQRSRELRGVNISYGSNIKELTQLIASYNWENNRLGPANAKKTADLFDGMCYDAIRKTKPELAYQIYIVDSNMYECQKELARSKKYMKSIRVYGRFAIFSLCIKALKVTGANFGHTQFTDQLREQWKEYYGGNQKWWKALNMECVHSILQAYKYEKESYSKVSGEGLTYANYFKSHSHMTKMLNRPVSRSLLTAAKGVLKAARK